MNKLTKHISYQSLKSSKGSKEQDFQEIFQRHNEMERFIYLLRKKIIRRKVIHP
jgi:hypothetical protein